jgi:prepilin-type N-terminal cleavage/methylation domain-containing protein
MKKYTRGFTLIELLVVIAIIGILASVVLVSLNSARKKGNDTRIISDVQQTRTALETAYTGSAYPDLINSGTGCQPAAGAVGAAVFNNCANVAANANSALTQLSTDANTQGVAGDILYYVGDNGKSYAIRGQLVSNSSAYFCIDSAGGTNALDNNKANVPVAGTQRCN